VSRWKCHALGRAAADERGFTLIETLITVWILGAVITAMMLALITVVRVSDQNSRTTLAEQELRRYAEVIRSLDYIPCESDPDVVGSYQANADQAYVDAGYTRPAGAQYSVPEVTYWNKVLSGSSVPDEADFVALGSMPAATCDATSPHDYGAQRVRVSVTVGVAPATTTVETTITKRDTAVY
jgi:prepilin-type N-terminal cleavage/methylation domain-containing protein